MNIDHIFLINLNHRTDRLNLSKQELEKGGIKNWNRFAAIKYDPKIHGYHDQFKKYCKLPKLKMTKQYLCGSFGCLLSHFNIIKLAKEKGYKSVLIVEDDFSFTEDWKENLNNCMDDLEFMEWNMFYLSVTNSTPPNTITDNLISPTRGYTTTGYIIKAKLYDIILDQILDYGKEIDVFYAEILQKRNDIFAPKTPIIVQRESYSDILGQNVNYSFCY